MKPNFELHFWEIAECHKPMILIVTDCVRHFMEDLNENKILQNVNYIVNILFPQHEFHIFLCFWQSLGIQLIANYI